MESPPASHARCISRLGSMMSDGLKTFLGYCLAVTAAIGPLTIFVSIGFNEGVAPPESGYLGGMPFFAPFGALAGLTFWRFAKFKNVGTTSAE